MAKRYAQPEWSITFEVRDAAGFESKRSADAVAMSMWPSRGLEIVGFEIKVNKYDWRREKATPEKAEAIAAYCDRWIIVTTPGVIDSVDELPPAWGWMELRGDKLFTRKEPQTTPAKPLTRHFVAALLRRTDKQSDAEFSIALARLDAARVAKFEETVRRAVEDRTRFRDSAIKAVEDFEATTGLQLTDGRWYSGQGAEVGRAVNAVIKGGLTQAWSSPFVLTKNLRDQADKIDAALREFGFDVPPELATAKKRRAVA